jgi:hypothetical protein
MALAVAALLRERAWRRRGGVPEHVRAEPHYGPGRVTVNRDSQIAPTITVRLEPDGDGGAHALRESGPMATAVPIQPLTARVFLFGGTQDSAAALAQALDEQGVLDSLGGVAKTWSQVGREAAGGQLATVAHGLLELDLGDLVVGGWRNDADLTVCFELCVEFVVRGLVATVRQGHLVAFRSGSCEVTATLAAEGRRLVTRQAQLQLPRVIRLGDGVPLLRDAVRPLAPG